MYEHRAKRVPMATDNAAEEPKRKMFLRGESMVASMGFAIAAILLAAVGATAWWTLRAQRLSLRTSRAEQIRAVSGLLSQSAESLLAANELSAVRRLVSEASLNHDLALCRIVLPNGQIVADADPARIAAQALPARWPKGPTAPDEESSSPDHVTIRTALHIPGQGPAGLEVAGAIDDPGWAYWEPRAGIGAIGAAALAALLLVYRQTRSRLQAVGAIREALLAFQDGETTTDALAVSANLGAEANAWNRLLAENKALRKRIAIEQAVESLESTQEARGDLAAACDALTQGMIFVDEKGRAKFVNGAAAVFLRAPREEIVGADVAEFIWDEKVLNSIRATAAGSICPRTTVEVERRDGSGSGVLRFSVRPVRGQDAATAVIVIEDVTQQRVAEEARNTFVAQATHELRTPLTNILLYVETALDEGPKDPAVQAKCLNVINQESRRLERIVGDILSVAEIEAGSFTVRKDDVRLDVLFEELQIDYDAQAREKQIDLRFDLPPKLPVLHGDRDKIVLALHNLLGNALKYTPAGGQVTVNVETDDNELAVQVVDTGIGISEDDAERIFEKFCRAKDDRVSEITGSGLGLALAREVVRLHGGDITVQSELDKGSTFTLTLPVAAEVAQHEDSRATAGSGHRSEA